MTEDRDVFDEATYLISEAYPTSIRIIQPVRKRIHGCDGQRFVQFVASPAVEGDNNYLCVLEDGFNVLATFGREIVQPDNSLLGCIDSVFEAVRRPDGSFVIVDCVYLMGKSIRGFDLKTRLEAIRQSAPGAEIIAVDTVHADAPRPGEWYRPLNDPFVRTGVMPLVKEEAFN